MKRELKRCKVLGNQLITADCVVCGSENPHSLRAQFCDLADGRTLCIFKTGRAYQSFPDRLHGGVTGMIMDELLNRTAMRPDSGFAGVTMELSLKYRAPLPLDATILAVGELVRDRERVFDAKAEVVLPDGTVAVQATGRCLKARDVEVGSRPFVEVFVADPRPFPAEVMI